MKWQDPWITTANSQMPLDRIGKGNFDGVISKIERAQQVIGSSSSRNLTGTLQDNCGVIKIRPIAFLWCELPSFFFLNNSFMTCILVTLAYISSEYEDNMGLHAHWQTYLCLAAKLSLLHLHPFSLPDARCKYMLLGPPIHHTCRKGIGCNDEDIPITSVERTETTSIIYGSTDYLVQLKFYFKRKNI